MFARLPRGQLWQDHILARLRVRPSDCEIVRLRIWPFLLRGRFVAQDLGVLDFIIVVLSALDRVEPECWAVIFQTCTFPKHVLIGCSLMFWAKVLVRWAIKDSKLHLACCCQMMFRLFLNVFCLGLENIHLTA